MFAKCYKFICASFMSLGVASVFALAPVFVGSLPVKAQTVDGRLLEYRPASAPVLNYGDRGPAVRDVQLFLRDLGYYTGSIDGFYGQTTASAIRDFQYVTRLRVDGVVGRNTWRALSSRVLHDTTPGLFD